MTLSDIKIQNLKPKSKTYTVADFDGLYIVINPNVSKLWRFKHRLEAKEKLLAIGVYPAISLTHCLLIWISGRGRPLGQMNRP